MNCFYHRTAEAVGICKSCARGLCSACAAEMEKGLACRGKCESDVLILNGILARSAGTAPTYDKILQAGKGSRFLGAGFYFVLGLLFLFAAIFQTSTHGFRASDVLTWGFGLLLTIFGLLEHFLFR